MSKIMFKTSSKLGVHDGYKIIEEGNQKTGCIPISKLEILDFINSPNAIFLERDKHNNVICEIPHA